MCNRAKQLRRVLSLVLLVLIGAPAAMQAQSPQYAPNEALVAVKAGASLPWDALMKQSDPEARVELFKSLVQSRRNTYLLVRSGNRSTQQLVNELRKDPAVAAVSPNYRRKVAAAPNDPRFLEQWSLQNTAQFVGGVEDADIDAEGAWEKGNDASSVVVGLIDTGVYYNHPDLKLNMWVNRGEIPGNGVDDDGNGYADDVHGFDFAANAAGGNDSDPMDEDGHGTSVAGIIGAVGDNGVGISGVAQRVKLMALKAMRPSGFFYSSDSIEALDYAIAMKERGVNIVALNASFGSVDGSQSDPVVLKLKRASDLGIVMVAAAGNDGSNNDAKNYYPAGYNVPGLLAVGASDMGDQRASYSNYGATTVDLFAPGHGVLTTSMTTASVTAGGNVYGANLFAFSPTYTVSGLVYDCGIGLQSEFPPGVSGNIALIRRGSYDGSAFMFSDKVINAMSAGAQGVIIYDDVNQSLDHVTLGEAGGWVPSLFISNEDGLALKDKGNVSATLQASTIGPSYEYYGGTSMAAPMVTGAVALAAAFSPNESAPQLAARIINSVDKKTAFSGYCLSGGRLNLNGSLQGLSGPKVSPPVSPMLQLLLF